MKSSPYDLLDGRPCDGAPVPRLSTDYRSAKHRTGERCDAGHPTRRSYR
jgi:hypothetical protein